jgi:hypothetical protein
VTPIAIILTPTEETPPVLNFTTKSTFEVVTDFRITVASVPAAVPLIFDIVAVTTGGYLNSENE